MVNQDIVQLLISQILIQQWSSQYSLYSIVIIIIIPGAVNKKVWKYTPICIQKQAINNV